MQGDGWSGKWRSPVLKAPSLSPTLSKPPPPASCEWLILLGAWSWGGSLPTCQHLVPLCLALAFSKMGMERRPIIQQLLRPGLSRGTSGVSTLPFHPAPQPGCPAGSPHAEGMLNPQLVCDLGPVSDTKTGALPGASHPRLRRACPSYQMKSSCEELINYLSLCYLTSGTLGPGSALRGTGTWYRDLWSQSTHATWWLKATPPPRPATSLGPTAGLPFFNQPSTCPPA